MFRQQLSPFLNNGFTLATFNASGKIPVSKDWFIIIVNGLEISHFIDLSSLCDISSLPEELNDEFEKVNLWLKQNKLDLNTPKTKLIFFCQKEIIYKEIL